MTDITTKPAVPPFTHTAYFFIRTGTTKRGKVYGYWKDGGRFRADSGDAFFAFVDMVPRSGWDGRIRFVKIGDPVPDTDSKAPERPDAVSNGRILSGEGNSTTFPRMQGAPGARGTAPLLDSSGRVCAVNRCGASVRDDSRSSYYYG